MTDAEKAAAFDKMQADARAANSNGNGTSAPPRYKAVVSLQTAGDRVLFSSVNENRVKTWIEMHCPRGQHFFLLSPDGSMQSFEYERQSGGPQGEDVEMWQPFDRAAYQAPELSPVNTNDPWADAWEGAQ